PRYLLDVVVEHGEPVPGQRIVLEDPAQGHRPMMLVGQLPHLRMHLVLGVGALGSPAALYLAAAGVGTLGLADHDLVRLSNLQRQVVHRTASVGMSKVEAAATQLAELNPEVRVQRHPYAVTAENAMALFGEYDLILDGTDTFAARY